jgi:hypothetical protein
MADLGAEQMSRGNLAKSIGRSAILGHAAVYRAMDHFAKACIFLGVFPDTENSSELGLSDSQNAVASRPTVRTYPRDTERPMPG